MVAPSFCIVLIPGKDCTEVVEICVPTVATTCKNTSVPRQEYREIPKTYKGNISYGVFMQEVWVSISFEFRLTRLFSPSRKHEKTILLLRNFSVYV